MKRLLRLVMGIALVAAGAACQDAEISVEKPAPRLISIVPSTVWNGCTAIISGTGFSTVAEENIVTVDGQTVAVTSATANRLTLTMPEHPDGKARVALTVDGKAADIELETVYAALPELETKVTGIAPVKGYAGDVVTISGENFGAAEGTVVKFGDVAATVQSAIANSIRVVAPVHEKGAVDVTVISNGKTMKAPSQFTYMVFSITSNAPTAGGEGDEVTLKGEGFSEVADDNIVLVNGQKALVKSATETSLVVVMPDNPEGKYNFTLTVGDKTITGGEFSYGGAWRVKTVLGASAGTTQDVAGTGLNARMKNAQDIVLAPDGSYWITIRGTHGVWKMTNVDETYTLSKIVATSGDDLLKNSYPWGGDFDSKGLFYIAGKGGNGRASCVLTCDASGKVAEYAIADVTLANVMKVLVDKSDNIYVLVRATAGQGFVIKVKDGKVLKRWNLTAKLYEMMCFNTDETKIFVFGNDAGDIQLIDVNSDSAPVRIAGTGTMHTDAATYTDGQEGQPLTATLRQCEGCICAADGTIYFTEIKGTVRTFTPGAGGDYSKGTIRTIAGQPYVATVKDGIGTAATFAYPAGMCLAADGKTLYMVDGTTNGTVRKIFYK